VTAPTHALLFELGTEELPPSELPAVLRALAELAPRLFEEQRLVAEGLRVYSTPRRLAVTVERLAGAQLPQRLRVTGPPRKAAFDASGAPTKAAEGFARTQGVAVDQLQIVQTERGEYLAVEREEPGRPAAAVVPALLERLVGALPFAKQMRWGSGDARFSRPIRWVVALLDDAVLPLRLADVEAGRLTHGHRFLCPQAIELAHARDYAAALERARVIPDVEARRALVRSQVAEAAAAHGVRAALDEGTLETVVHLVEHPMAIVGSFADSYLDLPREVVETPIRRHQKCFPTEDEGGRLAHLFVSVSNMPGSDPADIRRGNERVIRARLADADFYFREDLKVSPEKRLPALAAMVFQERLGSQLEKTERLTALVEWLAARVAPEAAPAAVRAARLSKSDLASGMVREFPELQGVMGEEYAARAGEGSLVARAIREQYLPRSADDALPASREGALLAIADKVDTIVGCIGVGLIPTGSQDPYGLRRGAQGVLQIALVTPCLPSLADLVDRALALLAPKLSEAPATTRQRVLDLFHARLSSLMAARGLRADIVEAVLSQGFDDPRHAVQRAEALGGLVGHPDWEPLTVAFKRAINILPARPIGAVDPARFVHDAERHLHEETAARRPRVLTSLEGGDYAAALRELSSLRPAVDRFFEAVMVMDPEPAIQENRLALLRALADLVLPIADLRKVQASR
jgi:glycyl-tRNA synthetase beta chain